MCLCVFVFITNTYEMIRERLQAEKHQANKQQTSSSSTSSTSTPMPEWHEDIVHVVQAIRPPVFDEESIMSRSRAIRAVKTVPHEVNNWRALLTLIDNDRKKDLEGEKGTDTTASLEMHNAMVRLYETATRVIPRSAANRYSPVYLSVWLDLARVHSELPEDAYIARDVFKQLKNNRIGTTLPQFWNAYADFEDKHGDPDKATKLRAEIARRCPAGGAVIHGGDTPGSAHPTSSVPRRPHAVSTTAATAAAGVASRRNALRHIASVEKENSPVQTHLVTTPTMHSPPAKQEALRPQAGYQGCARRGVPSTPPVPPQPHLKRMNVGTSPEAMRRDVRSPPFEEPDLMSSGGVVDAPPAASTPASVPLRAAPPTRSVAPHLSTSASWKLRSQQSFRGVGASSPMQNSGPPATTGGGMSHIATRRQGTNGTPYASYGHRRIDSGESASAQRRMVTPVVAESTSLRAAAQGTPNHVNVASSRSAISAVASNTPVSPPPLGPVVGNSGGSRRTESSSGETSSSKELRRRERDQRSHRNNSEENESHNNNSSNNTSSAILPSFLREISRDDVAVVNGRQYLILGSVGKGGSSRVYKVLNGNRSIMALKRVHVRKCANFKATFDSYANEIDLLQRLRGKPNIVYCYDAEVREDLGIIHLVMEYGDIDLAKRLNESTSKSKLIDDNFRRLYWQQMLEAVRTIHEAKIVHGDLKPANFLIVAGTLKLIDFGIAKAIPTEDTTKIFRDVQVGTPNYMSPEALISYDGDDDTAEMRDVGNGRPKYRVGRASDIWSLGCILYQMVYGKTPFAHLTNIMQKLTCIQDDSYAIQYPTVEDASVLSVLQGCLQRDPSKRMSIPDLLNHGYLRRGGRGDSMTTVNVPTSEVEAVARWLVQRLQTNGCDIRTPSGLRAPPTEGIDVEWDMALEEIAAEFPQEWCTSLSHRGGGRDTVGSTGLHGRRGMMTPTTSGVTNQGTRTHGHSLHSYNGSRSTER